MKEKLEINSLDQIVEQILDKIEESQTEVFEISETSRKEYEAAQKDLEQIKEETYSVIDQVDKTRKTNQKARRKLMQVSQDINKYSESDIKQAYEQAKDTQVELSILEEKENRLRQKRDDLQRRLKDLESTVQRAENLVSQIGVIRDFLDNDLQQFTSQIEDLKQKEQLGIKIIKAQEEERKRVAREVHDGPAQSLANVVFKLEYSEKLLKTDISKAKAELKDLKRLVKKSLEDVRKIIFDLRPMTLDDLGLIPTLRKYVNDFMEKTGLDIQFKVLKNEAELKSSYELAVYRVVQEALNNADQHAQAQNIVIKMEIKRDLINVIIEDDGCGFDVDQALENSAGRDSFGLLSMKERVELLQGELSINSKSGKGSRIILKIPF
jgi:two-component system sensor histidine kinase DegS